MEKKFGKAFQPIKSEERWWWSGGGITMLYDKTSGGGSLTISSQKFYEEIDKEIGADIPEEGF